MGAVFNITRVWSEQGKNEFWGRGRRGITSAVENLAFTGPKKITVQGLWESKPVWNCLCEFISFVGLLLTYTSWYFLLSLFAMSRAEEP